MRYALALLAALTLAPAPAAAGPWLRGAGEGFLSWTVKVQDDDDAKWYGTLYTEYGINPDLTVGLDLGSDEDGGHKALAFVLMPVSREGLHVAFELGAGTLDDGAALRPGLSVGRGLDWGQFGGWWALDTRLQITGGATDLAIDATLGVTLWEGTMVIGQLQEGGPLTDPDFLRGTASVVWQSAPGHHIEVGLSTALKDAEDFGLKIGMWHSF
ncbi:hypothetical protein [Roseovarius sp. D0-M9]|uniref:hypothetical protein n=1 Tax=Roseovarius sp. D0-M9 TaxID=3127117 RepID=UPI00301060C5